MQPWCVQTSEMYKKLSIFGSTYLFVSMETLPSISSWVGILRSQKQIGHWSKNERYKLIN